jgi:DNA repair photolyase
VVASSGNNKEGSENLIHISEVQVKELFSKTKLPDADYVCNPYVGCTHKCIYCYAEFMKRFTNHNDNWGDFIDIKKVSSIKIPEFKENQTILFSSVTDPYNSFEKKYEATRKILKKLTGTKAHVEILTKSALVTRDIDLIKQFSNIKVGISMNTLDDKFRKEIEPYASSVEKRLDVLYKLNAEGINTYVFISPIFPGICDYESIIEKIYKHTHYICFENLNLRGSYKGRVMNYIKDTRPYLLPLYDNIYNKNDNSYWERLKDDTLKTCEKYGVDCRIYFYHDKIKKK